MTLTIMWLGAFFLLVLCALVEPESPDGAAAQVATVFKPSTAVPLELSKTLRERLLLKTYDLQLGALMSQYHLYTPPALLLEHPPKRRFKKEVLGYVTPWNRRGYETSLQMQRMGKLDFAVPVWFRVVKRPRQAEPERGGGGGKGKGKGKDAGKQANEEGNEVHIEGVEDIDLEWLQEMRRPLSNPNSAHLTRILPRVKVETSLAGDDIATTVKLLSYLQEKHGFEGFTLEGDLNNLEAVLQLLVVMREYSMFVVLVVPPVIVPAGSEGDGMRRALLLLSTNADRLSVMTYDQRQGTGEPNAPTPWVRQIVQSLSFDKDLRRKILIGVPYYGWNSLGEDVTAEKLVAWMTSVYGPGGPGTAGAGAGSSATGAQGGNAGAGVRRDVALVWNKEAEEHVFVERAQALVGAAVDVLGAAAPVFTEAVRCYYPTHAMLYKRLRLVEKEQVAGVAIWELGQGFPSFMDLY